MFRQLTQIQYQMISRIILTVGLNLSLVYGANSSTLVDGVPSDLIPLIPFFSQDKNPPCELPRGSGMMSGICLAVPPALPFCGEYVDYPVCVPGQNVMWPNWNWTSKDTVVRDQVLRVIDARKNAEELSLANNGTSEEYLSIRFFGNDPCAAMYKRIVCYYNFPRCDESDPATASDTFPICTERCVDFFTTCKYGTDFAASVCDAAKSFWPLNSTNAIVNEESVALKSENIGICTGSAIRT